MVIWDWAWLSAEHSTGEALAGHRPSGAPYDFGPFFARFLFGGLPVAPERRMALSSILKIRPIAYLN